MSFDQNMIIDATRGSDARFVNHSCEPNCRMIKWIVSGQPRMALFAGDRDIMVGEELTYDYKFDPFSAKNVQKCLCGSPKCRGVLGPKPKEVKLPQDKKEAKADVKKTVKKGVAAGKRKLGEMLGEKNATSAAKKRKTATPSKKTSTTKVTKTTKAAAKPATKRAAPASKIKSKSAKMVKRSVSTIAVNAKATTGKIAKVKKTYSRTTQTKVSTTSKKGGKVIVAAGPKGALPSPEADEAPVDVYSFSPPTPRRGLDLIR